MSDRVGWQVASLGLLLLLPGMVLAWPALGGDCTQTCLEPGVATDPGPCGRCLGMLLGMGLGPLLGLLAPGRGAALARTAAIAWVPILVGLALEAADARAGSATTRSVPWLMGLMLTLGPTVAFVVAGRILLEDDVPDR